MQSGAVRVHGISNKENGQMQMSKLRLLTAMGCVLILVLCTGTASAGQLGHYTPAYINVRDLFVPPEEGIYYVQYNYLYTTDTLKNRDGDTVGSVLVDTPLGTTTLTVDPEVDVFAAAPVALWVSPWKVFGARHAALVNVGFATSSIDASLHLARSGRFLDQSITETLRADVGGVSDMFVQPVWLGWSGKHYDAAAAYGFYAPTGSDGISLEYWEHQFQATGAWYPWEDRRMSVMVGGTYEVGHERQDRDLTPGDRFTLNWGISQFLPLKKDLTILAELGVRGYSQWQLDADSGSAVSQLLNVQLNAKDRIHSVGLQAGLTFPPHKASLNFGYMWEFGAEARFDGRWVGLTFSKGF
jgi:hypothetical protein